MAKGLNTLELRVLGCLIEKSRATPDGYPLTLNSLCNACNQKTSRDPVMNLAESTVESAAESLKQRGLVSTRSGAGNSRVTKYSHRLGRDDRLFSEGTFGDDELAVLCIMMLRGPQTLSELKSRSNRLYGFASTDDVAKTLTTLAARTDGPWVIDLGRGPGQKENRFMHLCATDEDNANIESLANNTESADTSAQPGRGALESRVEVLETEVAALRKSIDDLRTALGED